jgi:hypothetical protein
MRCRLPWRPLILAALSLAAGAGCFWPTGADIERSLAEDRSEELRSVAGDWTGIGPAGAFTLRFRLTEAAGGQVTGSGTMQERGAAAAPLTVTGSYRRPALALAFEGLVYEGRAVRGTFAGPYTSFYGVSDTLVLTGVDYTRRLPVLLVEANLPSPPSP